MSASMPHALRILQWIVQLFRRLMLIANARRGKSQHAMRAAAPIAAGEGAIPDRHDPAPVLRIRQRLEQNRVHRKCARLSALNQSRVKALCTIVSLSNSATTERNREFGSDHTIV